MRLTAETYEQVSASLRADLAAGGREQRGEPRVGLRARVRVVPLVVDDRGRAAAEMWVRDLSAHGVALAGAQALPKGCEFLLRLPRSDGSSLDVKYKVAWTTPTPGGGHLIGAKRVPPPPAATAA